ncbi:MNIO family bufferin maturase [Sphingomonas mali]|uniref:MNIO family bufferin maturase n=1 Tax=Sphingomonas mali TaxID=40682 RepID=UPI000831CB9F|nr:DUF692 domain-containing protein [Sphingomonas mali]
MPPKTITPFQGFGLGLRIPHFQQYLSEPVPVDFVEIISENFMVAGGRPLHVLDQVRERWPIAMHGVSMSIGSADGVRADYLVRLKALADRVRPLWISDHLSWSRLEHVNSHDLLPLPLTDEALDTVCRNILHVQDVLERPLVLENPSTYLTFVDDQMTEWAFLAEMTRRTGCYLLLDVNNIYVSGANNGFDPYDYLAGVPADRVRQIHLAGHSQGRDRLIDTHDQPVSDPVWDLFARIYPRLGPVAAMIERDDNIPALDALLEELAIARRIAANVTAAAA